MNSVNGKDLLTLLFKESEAYSQITDIEKIIQDGTDLSCIPIQPLYLSLKSTSEDQVAEILPKLSSEQRAVLMDMDIWHKDEFDLDSFDFWSRSYIRCKDEEVLKEFAHSEQFLLFLKSRFTITTFDIEEPEYPDNDNFFLTEDGLLLFEYPEDFYAVEEVRQMVKVIYIDWGVDRAYNHLLRLISDSSLLLQEKGYQSKKERLRDYGFVDYFDALEFNQVYSTLSMLNSFIDQKTSATGTIDILGNIQALHSSTLIPYQTGMNDLINELIKIDSEKRRDFLRFNFIRMVNSTLSLADAYKGGSVAIGRVGLITRDLILLGYSYLNQYLKESGKLDSKDFSDGVFSHFEFSDLYRIGNTLVSIVRNKIKKALAKGKVDFNDQYESFLGGYWNTYLRNTFMDRLQYRELKAQKFVSVNSMEVYEKWKREGELFVDMLPYIATFFVAFENLKNKDLIQDSFFENYDVADIDFEAIIISSFVNFALGNYDNQQVSRMGLSLQEFRKFIDKYLVNLGESYTLKGLDDKLLNETVNAFCNTFGFSALKGFPEFLVMQLEEHLSGYEYHKLSDVDFKHVGGPILLSVDATK